MNWFYNLKIRTKLLIAFTMVALIAAFIGLMGFNAMSQMQNNEQEIVTNSLPSIQALLTISQAQTDIDSAENSLIFQGLDSAGHQEQYNRIAQDYKAVDNAWKIYEVIPNEGEEKATWESFKTAWDIWIKDDQGVVQLSKEWEASKNPEVYQHLVRQVMNSDTFSKANTVLQQLIKINKDAAEVADKNAMAQYKSTSLWLLVIIMLGIAFAVGLGLLYLK